MILFVGICLGGKLPMHCGGRDGNGRLRMASGLEFRGVSSPAGKRDFNLSVALRQKKKQCSENFQFRASFRLRHLTGIIYSRPQIDE